MGAVAEVVGEGLGHEGGYGADAFGDLLDHEAQEHEAIGHGERVRVAEVELVLPAATFLVVGVKAPTETLQVTGEGLEESVGLGGERDVVTSIRAFEARARDGRELS